MMHASDLKRSTHAEQTGPPAGSTLQRAREDLRRLRVTSEVLIRSALDAALCPDGEGATVFTKVYEEQALLDARAADERLRDGGESPALLGIPVSIKDAFDVAGEVTHAGSMVLAHRSAAECDAVAVTRLKAAGAVIVGRSNMSEFGYSGLGLNAHYSTPRNPYDRQTGRIPGGSSSGAAVSVADGMAMAAIGTDTGGSVRIPAALCGLVAFKPTAEHIPQNGMVPLSPTHDSVGVLGRSVHCCAVLYAVLAGKNDIVLEEASLEGLKLAVPTTVVLDDLEPGVADAFERALQVLSRAGAPIIELDLPELRGADYMDVAAGLLAAESHWWHKALIKTSASHYDPDVLANIRIDADLSAFDYVKLLRERGRQARRLMVKLHSFDAVLMPTVPIIAPLMQPLLAEPLQRHVANVLMLRNPSLVNFLDWCALSVPRHAPGEAPVGLTIAGRWGGDLDVLAIGQAVESSLRTHH